ncbi:MAG TPA: hypothetical protein VIH71_10865 [Solirubrobacteraceae bacterium]
MAYLVGAVGQQLVAEAGRDLDVADACGRLAVGDPQAGTVGIVKADIALQDVERFGDPRAGVAEHRAQCAPADAVVGRGIGLALREHRHRPRAQPVLEAKVLLHLAARKTSANLRGLLARELGALARPGRRLQVVRRVQQHHELVYLKKRPSGLGDLDLQARITGWVVLAHLVLDGLGEDLAEQPHHHLDRARRESSALASVLILGSTACRCDLLQSVTVREQLASKAPAVRVADPCHWRLPKRRQDVLLEPPEVVLVGGVGQRPVADLADAPALQPVGGVLVHRDPVSVLIVIGDRLWLVASEHLLDRDASAELREDRLKLAPSPRLGPAVDVAAEDHAAPLPPVPEPGADADRSVCQRDRFDGAACRAGHHALPSRLDGDKIPG